MNMEGIWSVLNRMRRAFASALVVSCVVFAQNTASSATIGLVATVVGGDATVFDPARDACDGHDVPDAPLRAYRDAGGTIRAFGLHYENRRLSGPSLMRLKPECPVVFRGTGSGDPARYDDKSWITATWTEDGRQVDALVHHEFHAHSHAGRCRFPDYMACWWNTVLAARSPDGGQSFQRRPGVVAATPFRSEIGQGRHRGFFNPSNIVRHDGQLYALIGTTGWSPAEGGSDQPGGVCLFRADPRDPAAWRAFDGKGFGAAFPDPYRPGGGAARAARCQPIAPFPAPVGSVVRHRPSGLFLAVYQAKAGMPDGFGGTYPQSGFYTATSPDLRRWDAPQLLLATKSLYDDACGAGKLRSYPVLIDEAAQGRNFDDIGDTALLFYAEMRIDGCNHTGDRKLIARKVRISSFRTE